jgi:hypothetical protein
MGPRTKSEDDTENLNGPRPTHRCHPRACREDPWFRESGPALDDTGGATVFLSLARDRDPECRAEHGFAMTKAANLM